MKTTCFSAVVFFFFCLGIAPFFAWAGDFIPQTFGMYDTIYELRNEVDCRSCHGADLSSRHHALGLGCSNCHTQHPRVVDNCLDCHDGHDHEGHHTSEQAAGWDCTVCHDGTLIDAYQSVPPSYPPTDYTPRPYRCKACHNSSPNPPGPGDPDPPLVGIDGSSPATNTHHNTRGHVCNETTCQNCHDDTKSHTDPYQIRYCQRCHSAATLHSIPGHGEPHCAGCHSDTVVMQILDVWTSTPSGWPKRTFVPGAWIRFNVRLRIIGNPDIQQRAGLWGKAVGLPDWDWEMPLDMMMGTVYPGEYMTGWIKSVPLEAVPGTYPGVGARLGVVDVGMTPWIKERFMVSE